MTTTLARDRLLRLVLVLLLLACLPGLWLGLSMAGDDLSQQGEWLDGLGTLYGLVIAGAVALPMVLAAIALRSSLRGRAGAPVWAAGAASCGLLVGLGFVWADDRILLLLAVPALVGVVAVGALIDRDRS